MPGGRRQEIIQKAAVLFDRSGYHRASMGDIADAVGIRKPSLYHYFESKAHILFEIHEQMIDLTIAKLQARSAQAAPLDALRGVAVDILELMETHEGHLRVYFEHHRELPDELRRLARIKRDRYHGLVEDLVVAGMREGLLRPGNARLTTLAYFGMCNWAYQWFRPRGPRTAREVAEELWAIFALGAFTDVAASAPLSEA